MVAGSWAPQCWSLFFNSVLKSVAQALCLLFGEVVALLSPLHKSQFGSAMRRGGQVLAVKVFLTGHGSTLCNAFSSRFGL